MERLCDADPDVAYWVVKLCATWAAEAEPQAPAHRPARRTHTRRGAPLEALPAATGAPAQQLVAAVQVDARKQRDRRDGRWG